MTKTDVTQLLTDMEISPNMWVSPDQLYLFVLQTDGSQRYDPLTTKLYFDTKNELLKVKDYLPIPKSQFLTGKNISSTKILVKNAVVPKFRMPQKGDIIYAAGQDNLSVSSDGKYIKSTISNIITRGLEYEIELSNPLTSQNWIYSDTDIETTTKNMYFAKKEMLIYELKEYTKYEYDTAMSFLSISGLSFQHPTEVW